ncbi:MAG TPA: amidohydrolase family protein [Verrucomicrobiae bacterium]|jgi:aminocarboxymuconate-semialdehyde decarboxylase|nr:amidohydrolase family protein [Verrucomicrobiae bacterium]
MPGRRKFLKNLAGASAGLCFVNCGLARAVAAAQQSLATPPKRRRVTLGGRPVRTIDIHAHCYVDLQDLIQGHPEALVPNGGPPTFDGPFLSPTKEVDARLRHMDEHGIDIQAVSLAPAYNYWADRDLATKIVSRQNEQIAAMCAAHPDRLVGLGGLALQHPDLAVEQMDHGVKQLGFRGFEIGGSVNGDELANPKFNPVWAKAEELGTFLLLHPATFVEGLKRFQGNGFLPNVIGNPLETTVAFSHLIFEGTLDRYPGLKICGSHGGGYLASYAGRMDHCAELSNRCKPVKKHPSEYFKSQLYCDSVVFTNEGLRHLVAEVGVSHTLFGTDFPFDVADPFMGDPREVDSVLGAPGLNEAEQRAILGENAAKLLGIK